MKSAQNTVLRLWIELTKSVTYTYGKAMLTWFEEIFEEFKTLKIKLSGLVGVLEKLVDFFDIELFSNVQTYL